MSILQRFLTHDTRLLQLSTPLGQDQLIVECMHAQEGLSQCFELRLSVLSTDAAISTRALLGQPALLQLLTAASRDDLRAFHGHVSSAACLGADGGLARYELTISPWYAFLGYGRDSRIFQDKTVFEILDAVFGSWPSLGKLVPAWRYDILKPELYLRRSLTTQYQESALAFAERLMRDEGLFYYFEHEADPDSGTLGKHTMVIADHNGSFAVNRQASVRFTQPGAVMKEDSIDRWRSETRWLTDVVQMRSWDYRTRDDRPVEAGSSTSGGKPPLASRDAPGAYRYQTRAQGQRMADQQIQARDAARQVFIGAGTVRTLAAGTTFTLRGHPLADMAADDEERSFVIVRVLHLAHNNLSTDARLQATKLLGESPLQALIGKEQRSSLHATGTAKGERPLYRNRIDAIRKSVPYRSGAEDGHGVVLHPRPTVRGQQSAIVVGPEGAVIHTDRDHRIKVQFHWQRGAGDSHQSHSRLQHPAPDGHSGAPGSDESGTWVRIATPMAPIAGANWGSVAVPRVGSEVLIDFIEGDIDRPVVIGSLYNGVGQANAQGNTVNQGAGVATGNAPAWFPGDSEGHAHPAVLSGFKTQALQASQHGGGAFNQLVFNDSSGQAAMALQCHAREHQGTAELNLGHLRHQTDNQLLKAAGFGAELKTEHATALRAGQGMLLTTHARSDAGASQLDAREAQAQVEQSHQLQISLATTAQKHNAQLKDAAGKPEAPPAELPAVAQVGKSIDTLSSTQAGAGGDDMVTAFGAAQLQLSAAAGIAASTPASTVIAAGATSSMVAGQDINVVSQAKLAHIVKSGISLFTYGKASGTEKANQECGLRLHAASGKVSSQSQKGETRMSAAKLVAVNSVTKSVAVTARQHVMFTAQGAFLKLEGGNIMLHGPGKITFKAGSKELSGPQSASQPPVSLPDGSVKGCASFTQMPAVTGQAAVELG